MRRLNTSSRGGLKIAPTTPKCFTTSASALAKASASLIAGEVTIFSVTSSVLALTATTPAPMR